MKVVWTGRALLDLEEIKTHIEADDPKTAARIALELLTRALTLRRLPSLGRPGRVVGTRELVAAPWVLAYRVVGAEVWVLRALHGSRKWPTKFSSKRRA